MHSAHDPLYHHHRCQGKQRYESKREAKEAARVTTSKHGRRMSPYECPCCGWWHLTKLSKTAQDRATRAALRERGVA